VLGILMYFCVHSGACAPGSPNVGPLATISVAMYRTKLLCVTCSIVLLACGKTGGGGSSQQTGSFVVQPASSQTSITSGTAQPAQMDAMQIKGFYLGMDIQSVPDAMMAVLADQQLSGFGFTGAISQGNGAQCVLMYTKPFMNALEQRARDRYGVARAQGKVDEEVLASCENSDGVMTVHAGADGKVTRIQFNDVRNLFNTQGASPAEFVHHLAAEIHIPEFKPDDSQVAWNYTSPQGTNITVETKNALGISMLRLIMSRIEP
jgi:hypothetical protein